MSRGNIFDIRQWSDVLVGCRNEPAVDSSRSEKWGSSDPVETQYELAKQYYLHGLTQVRRLKIARAFFLS
jgi:hypothetical protein